MRARSRWPHKNVNNSSGLRNANTDYGCFDSFERGDGYAFRESLIKCSIFKWQPHSPDQQRKRAAEEIIQGIRSNTFYDNSLYVARLLDPQRRKEDRRNRPREGDTNAHQNIDENKPKPKKNEEKKNKKENRPWTLWLSLCNKIEGARLPSHSRLRRVSLLTRQANKRRKGPTHSRLRS